MAKVAGLNLPNSVFRPVVGRFVGRIDFRELARILKVVSVLSVALAAFHSALAHCGTSAGLVPPMPVSRHWHRWRAAVAAVSVTHWRASGDACPSNFLGPSPLVQWIPSCHRHRKPSPLAPLLLLVLLLDQPLQCHAAVTHLPTLAEAYRDARVRVGRFTSAPRN